MYFIEPKRAVVPVIDEAVIGREGFNVVVKTGGSTYVIGRDLTVSRNHARIVRVKNKYIIEDLGSLNGTRVNGKLLPDWSPRVPGSKIEIKGGDVVEIGVQTIFRVEFKEEIEEESTKKDHCKILLLVKNYLQEALVSSYKLKEEMTENNLRKLLLVLKDIVEKDAFRKAIIRLSDESLQALQHHISVMKTSPCEYLSTQEFINGLIRRIEEVVEIVNKEWGHRACSQYEPS